jgi:hypothetical protein
MSTWLAPIWYCFLQARDAEKRAKKQSDIPIPMVRDLPSYERDYLPVFRENTTYIRGRGGYLCLGYNQACK